MDQKGEEIYKRLTEVLDSIGLNQTDLLREAGLNTSLNWWHF
jgi:hypothetical protein